ncbi:hypothetical protein GCM10007972_22570 [Iodidimonas muriae]|uniref:DUF2497 domain-containing protein n=1 Tax=Iodidimonas muriae TaxID=261467 RepID=A0ABQ2LFB0_9PROT|nr:DUF2497 domain-containing protein [Iodidimonas muriae]GER07742.1 hypothetical protein JCM17843_20520 [Kordiimonadales bacterium JCM 17843]GGO14934.1 hypothetical protein GCM10007972_22570 [Iodidimonas muriae]
MEEILASIRRIISEDSADEGESSSDESRPVEETQPKADSALDQADMEPEPAPEPEPEPEPAFEPEPEPEDDVLELTDFVEAESEPEPDFDEPDSLVDDLADKITEEALVSSSTEERSSASFAELSAMLVGGYEGAGNTLEGLVREMLKPMLRAWLDENLPRIVEDMVEREVARIAARGGRK